MTDTDHIVVRCDRLEAAARAADDIARQAAADLRLLGLAVGGVIDGAPGTMSAEAAGRFGDRWTRRLDRLIDDTELLAHKLRRAAANYCGTDAAAAGSLGAAVGAAVGEAIGDAGGSDGTGETGIPGVPGGGYVPPHSDYGD